jgi:integrase
MVRLQRVAGLRPGEVCRIRQSDIDMTGAVWIYRLANHKTAYRGKNRTIALGPQAQELLKPFLTDDPEAFLFCPRKAMEEINAIRAAKRTTKFYESGRQRRKAKPKRKPGERYSVCSYGYAIRRACLKSGIPQWHPNQLRHSFGTDVRKRYGLEGAQVGLGHSRADVTQVYAERDLSLAERIAKEIG